MTKTQKTENQLLKEFRKLSSEGKGEVFQYTKWMRALEDREKVREFRNNSIKGQKRSEFLSESPAEGADSTSSARRGCQ